MQNIALIGKLGSGKDAAARELINTFGYTRVAFADPLKQMVREADPIVRYEPTGYGPLPIHLSNVLESMTFEEAKRRYPEVRRSLQRIGQGARKIDPDYWVRAACNKIDVLTDEEYRVVVTDCRYLNEVRALKARGFKTVRIIRSQVEATSADAHESETALDTYQSDFIVYNNDSLSALHRELSLIASL